MSFRERNILTTLAREAHAEDECLLGCSLRHFLKQCLKTRKLWDTSGRGLIKKKAISDHHPYVAPGLPFALPPVDSQRAEHFDWINCTRYNPPKIHRDLSTTSLGNCTISELPKKRKYLSRSPRIPFNSAQLSVLEEQFRQAPYLSGAEVQRLANELDMSDVRVKIWFQNRRAREKRERLAKTTTGQHQIADAATLPTQARSAMELNSDKRGPSDSLGTSAEHLQSVELALLPQSNRKCHS
ncbi:homeobox protein MSX-2-like isoform X2 [Varroa destructor]|uniref:Homeobox domain-containing protein n=1 Tax=Varroa destructor TaxID=109461 RepID=A0A7M7M8J4_VARDE|nr:homeobox protein MSX-2-like isoform X2 [Varroa destructor]